MTDTEKVPGLAELMNSPTVLDVEAREHESIEAVLKRYDELSQWRNDNAEYMQEAELNPALYAGADEERADINEAAIEILDRLVTAVRRIWDGPVRVTRPSDTKRLEDLVHEAQAAVDPDDTDNREAGALWAALDEALDLLGRDDLR